MTVLPQPGDNAPGAPPPLREQRSPAAAPAVDGAAPAVVVPGTGTASRPPSGEQPSADRWVLGLSVLLLGATLLRRHSEQAAPSITWVRQ